MCDNENNFCLIMGAPGAIILIHLKYLNTILRNHVIIKNLRKVLCVCVRVRACVFMVKYCFMDENPTHFLKRHPGCILRHQTQNNFFFFISKLCYAKKYINK